MSNNEIFFCVGSPGVLFVFACVSHGRHSPWHSAGCEQQPAFRGEVVSGQGAGVVARREAAHLRSRRVCLEQDDDYVDGEYRERRQLHVQRGVGRRSAGGRLQDPHRGWLEAPTQAGKSKSQALPFADQFLDEDTSGLTATVTSDEAKNNFELKLIPTKTAERRRRSSWPPMKQRLARCASDDSGQGRLDPVGKCRTFGAACDDQASSSSVQSMPCFSSPVSFPGDIDP